MSAMRLSAICRGQGGMIAGRKPYRSGIDKQPVKGPVMIDAEGIVGDVISNRKHHGGPEQALLIDGGIDRAFWEAELGRPLPPGAFGENLFIDGLDHRIVHVGDRFEIGEIVLEVTSPRIPCATFAAHLGLRDLVKRYTKAGRPGIYVRVLTGGMIEAGLPVRYTPFAGDKLPLSRMMAEYGKPPSPELVALFRATPVTAKALAGLAD